MLDITTADSGVMGGYTDTNKGLITVSAAVVLAYTSPSPARGKNFKQLVLASSDR